MERLEDGVPYLYDEQYLEIPGDGVLTGWYKELYWERAKLYMEKSRMVVERVQTMERLGCDFEVKLFLDDRFIRLAKESKTAFRECAEVLVNQFKKAVAKWL